MCVAYVIGVIVYALGAIRLLEWMGSEIPSAVDRLGAWSAGSELRGALIVICWPFTYTLALMLCRADIGDSQNAGG
jgi:hypothetical protein